VTDARNCQQNLTQAAASRDWDAVREAAHALKGVAGNLGAVSVTERCLQIMRATDEALAREHSKLINELSAQLSSVLEHSRSEVARLTRSSQNQDAPDADAP
jgi:two-component system sensor histidine kinase RpfC